MRRDEKERTRASHDAGRDCGGFSGRTTWPGRLGRCRLLAFRVGGVRTVGNLEGVVCCGILSRWRVIRPEPHHRHLPTRTLGEQHRSAALLGMQMSRITVKSKPAGYADVLADCAGSFCRSSYSSCMKRTHRFSVPSSSEVIGSGSKCMTSFRIMRTSSRSPVNAPQSIFKFSFAHICGCWNKRTYWPNVRSATV